MEVNRPESEGEARGQGRFTMVYDNGLRQEQFTMVYDNGLRQGWFTMVYDDGLRQGRFTMVYDDGLRQGRFTMPWIPSNRAITVIYPTWLVCEAPSISTAIDAIALASEINIATY